MSFFYKVCIDLEMHPEATDFTLFVKRALPENFTNVRVLDVGSGDINGNNQSLFTKCVYEGNDVVPAKNVTIVSKTKDLPFEESTFDTIVSTECFEHDPEYKESLQKIYSMLKPTGLFFFTCASTGRGEHGTRRTCPEASFGTIANIENMRDYYKNLTEEDIDEALHLRKSFSCWDTYYNLASKDLYFVGIKGGRHSLPTYNNKTVKRTSRIILCKKERLP